MEARTADSADINTPFYSFDDQVLIKQLISELRYEILDLRKDLTFEISQLKIIHDHYIKESVKELEMRMYHFITKAVITSVGVLGGLQSFFHFMK
jgi:hypothetical protein